jgi:hypothetical protein
VAPVLARQCLLVEAFLRKNRSKLRPRSGGSRLSRKKAPPLWAAPLAKSTSGLISEEDLCTDLDVSRRADIAVPPPEVGTRDIDVKGSGASCVRADIVKVVPVPKIEELGPDLDGYCFCNARVLYQTEVVIGEAKAP